MTIANESAFPEIFTERRSYPPDTYSSGGLTKREYFAANCPSHMLNIVSHPEEFSFKPRPEDYAAAAVSWADALIAELEREK